MTGSQECNDANRVCMLNSSFSSSLSFFFSRFRLNTTSTFDLHHTLNSNPYASTQVSSLIFSFHYNYIYTHTCTVARALIYTHKHVPNSRYCKRRQENGSCGLNGVLLSFVITEAVSCEPKDAKRLTTTATIIHYVVLPFWLARYWSALFVPANGSLYVMING